MCLGGGKRLTSQKTWVTDDNEPWHEMNHEILIGSWWDPLCHGLFSILLSYNWVVEPPTYSKQLWGLGHPSLRNESLDRYRGHMSTLCCRYRFLQSKLLCEQSRHSITCIHVYIYIQKKLYLQYTYRYIYIIYHIFRVYVRIRMYIHIHCIYRCMLDYMYIFPKMYTL